MRASSSSPRTHTLPDTHGTRKYIHTYVHTYIPAGSFSAAANFFTVPKPSQDVPFSLNPRKATALRPLALCCCRCCCHCIWYWLLCYLCCPCCSYCWPWPSQANSGWSGIHTSTHCNKYTLQRNLDKCTITEALFVDFLYQLKYMSIAKHAKHIACTFCIFHGFSSACELRGDCRVRFLRTRQICTNLHLQKSIRGNWGLMALAGKEP